MIAKSSSPVAAKQAEIITPFTTMFDRWYEVFVLLWFSPNPALCIMVRHLYLGLSCPKDIVLWFVQMLFCKP